VRAALQPILLRVQAQGGTVRNLTIRIRALTTTPSLLCSVMNETKGTWRSSSECQRSCPKSPWKHRAAASAMPKSRSPKPTSSGSRSLAAITARDYFNAPAGVAARAAVQQCSDASARFEAAALVAEFGDGETDNRHNSHGGLTVVKDGP
jgi:hypothetical protein